MWLKHLRILLLVYLLYIGPLPQQLPGPAQEAWAGFEPQQAVSPGPGKLFFEGPERDECAESNFLRLLLPQAWH